MGVAEKEMALIFCILSGAFWDVSLYFPFPLKEKKIYKKSVTQCNIFLFIFAAVILSTVKIFFQPVFSFKFST